MRKLIAIIVSTAVLLAPYSALAAIAYGGSNIAGGNGNSFDTTLTTAGSNITIVGMIRMTASSDTSDHLSSITSDQAGTCTVIDRNSAGAASDNLWTYSFVCTNAAAAATTITAHSSSFTSGSITVAISYYTGTSGAQPDSNNKGSWTATSGTLATTVVVANSWTVIGDRATGTISASGGTTQRQNFNSLFLGDSNGTVTAGSHSLGASTDASVLNVVDIVSIAPYVPPPPTSVAGLVHSFFIR